MMRYFGRICARIGLSRLLAATAGTTIAVIDRAAGPETTTVMRRREFLLMGAGALVASLSNVRLSSAQTYPSGPIKVVVPYPPGGAVDVVARNWAEKARSVLGTVIIENIAGSGGTIGAAAVKRSKPDGYSLLFGETSCLLISPYLMASPPYDPAKDFSPISMLATSFNSVVVGPGVPVKDFAEFVQYAREQKGKLSYGSSGIGTTTHVAAELFKQLTGIPDIVHVPYRGAAPALVDVMGGVIPMATPNITNQILALHREGKVRILAVFAPSRLRSAPDIPVANETIPGMVMHLTTGLVAPAGTPDHVIAAVAKASERVMADPEFQNVIETSGMEARADLTPAGAQAFLDEERARLIPIMKTAGLLAQQQ
jgi:tripartite-type tricarboxylate transporter receptor subunit TctC